MACTRGCGSSRPPAFFSIVHALPLGFAKCFSCSVSKASIWWRVSSLIAWICGPTSWRERLGFLSKSAGILSWASLSRPPRLRCLSRCHGNADYPEREHANESNGEDASHRQGLRWPLRPTRPRNRLRSMLSDQGERECQHAPRWPALASAGLS
jgi:hypothetical protein